jgi:hypothetical protein
MMQTLPARTSIDRAMVGARHQVRDHDGRSVLEERFA